MTSLLKIHPSDDVAVALRPVTSGEEISLEGGVIKAVEDIPQGHKIALRDIAGGENIIKYGCAIGHATHDIPRGGHVHVHDMATNLSDDVRYSYHPVNASLPRMQEGTFMGYCRRDGRAAIRNELWIIPTVGCVNSVAQNMARENQHLVTGSVDGLYAFTHPFGCSQMAEDHARTRRILADLVRHPNAGGVLVLGLGCENNTMAGFKEELGQWDEDRVKFLICQESEDEMADGARLLAELAEYARGFERTPIGASELIVGLKCGGSDGLSGITANPTVGRFSDLLIAQGGSTILTEVPEMFGAETLLMDRCCDEDVFDQAVDMINGFKDYFRAHGQVVYENPSPGNKEGGITTLEDKSCGCVQKGGSAPIVDVLNYADRVKKPGLSLLSGPGNDLVSTTALSAAGAHMILFTTGRGTPFGAPVPTVKIASNSTMAAHKKNWIDFDAGAVAGGESLDSAGERLMSLVLEVASGHRTRTEINGFRDISIFKDGVVL